MSKHQRLSPGPSDSIAHGSFIDSDETASNFGQLRITTESYYEDGQQLFAAGFLEGYLTAHRIHQNLLNTRAYFRSLNLTGDGPIHW